MDDKLIAYPVGAFAHSHGLETAIQHGQIATAADFQNWLADVLEFGSGRNDCILLRAAHDCDSSEVLLLVDASACASASSSERLQETQLQW